MRLLVCALIALALCCFAGVAGAAPRLAPPPPAAVRAATPGPCHDATLATGAITRICVPASGWNGDLIVFAHGYAAPGQPLAPQDPSFNGAPLSSSIQGLGYAFATTSYRRNGLAVLEGAADIRDLLGAFPAAAGQPAAHTYLLGFSEGALVTTLLAEQSRTLVSGAIAACGPIGDFERQTGHFGDFRVLFDYFFPGKLPASPVSIPQSVIDTWASAYAPTIAAAVAANPSKAGQLIATSGAAINSGDPATVVSTTLDLLWYNVFATNDARGQLGGNPYDNRTRVYSGSSDDTALNAGVQRFDADAAALAALAPYQTSGRPQVPLVVLHTTLDDVVPFEQFTLYKSKAQAQRSPNATFVPVERYGHCQFNSGEILAAFSTLVQQAHTPRPQIYLPLAKT